MKFKIKILLIICSVILSITAVALAIHIWQATPFFNMQLVFLDTMIVLLTAAFLAIAMLKNTD